ncbi:hypothetical protein ZTR_04799 [Talaromyces verruculosus]|nr:hypothetical protein ZTR_04799 [Talaromyces verruculosus]
MAAKRKATLDVFPGQNVNINTSIKRLSLGWGAWEKYHQHGQDLARKGKYEEAIQVLSEALLQKNADTLKIMDSRSAVYCKMGLYEKALSDAKHMIRAAAKDERGYLRAGKALLLAEKPEKALDVYAYGLKALGEQHPQKEAVAKVHAKLAAKMSSQYRDPIFSLNSDCLLQIFQCLPFRQIVSLTRVSKAWRVYIKDQPILWSDISFQGPKAAPDVIRACIHNSQNRVKRLQLHNVRDPLNAAQQASRCPRLEHIDIDGNLAEHHIYNLFHMKQTLKTLILSEKIPLCRHMLWTLLGLPKLERVEVRRLEIELNSPKSEVAILPNLKFLSLGPMRKVLGHHRTYFKPFWVPRDATDIPRNADSERQNGYFDRVPNLREFSLGARNEIQALTRLWVCLPDILHPKLRLLALTNLVLLGTLNLPETLEHLHLTDCNIMCPNEMPAAPLVLPHLKSLVLRNIDCLLFPIAEILQNTAGSLEILEIIECTNTTPMDILANNKDGFKNLKKLHLLGVDFYSLETPSMLTMLQMMPRLKELHIPHTKVTGTLIRKILEGLGVPPVEFLNLIGCLDVSAEAVEYGRANGLKIMRC